MSKDRNDYQRVYTHPELREGLQEELKASDKGGAPGQWQWSARKSQLLAQEHEKHGGGYRHPERPTEDQQGLAEWTEQRWMTESGSANARHDGKTERYLPERAWEELSSSERRETQRSKQSESRRGKQRSPNPPAGQGCAQSFRVRRALRARGGETGQTRSQTDCPRGRGSTAARERAQSPQDRAAPTGQDGAPTVTAQGIRR